MDARTTLASTAREWEFSRFTVEISCGIQPKSGVLGVLRKFKDESR
jgi:hypothetical protein